MNLSEEDSLKDIFDGNDDEPPFDEITYQKTNNFSEICQSYDRHLYEDSFENNSDRDENEQQRQCNDTQGTDLREFSSLSQLSFDNMKINDEEQGFDSKGCQQNIDFPPISEFNDSPPDDDLFQYNQNPPKNDHQLSFNDTEGSYLRQSTTLSKSSQRIIPEDKKLNKGIKTKRKKNKKSKKKTEDKNAPKNYLQFFSGLIQRYFIKQQKNNENPIPQSQMSITQQQAQQIKKLKSTPNMQGFKKVFQMQGNVREGLAKYFQKKTFWQEILNSKTRQIKTKMEYKNKINKLIKCFIITWKSEKTTDIASI